MDILLAAVNPVGASSEHLVLYLLYQLIAIFIATRIVVFIATKFLGQTDVSGEILAGIVMGPSLLGALFPEQMNKLFDPSTATAFTAIAQIGLIFLMFQIGQEFEFSRTVSTNKTTIVSVSICGIVVPFTLGYLSSQWFYERLPEPRPILLGFSLFFAVAMSITAIPILGRIFMELKLSHTRTAAIVIGAAAIDDVMGWLILGAVAAIVKSNFDMQTMLIRIIALGVYLGIVFFVARPIIKRAITKHLDYHQRLQPAAIAFIILVIFISAAITSNIGVFAIIGGFVIGVALHDDRQFVSEWRNKISPIINILFLPIFFTYTGLRTSVGSLNGVELWGICLLVCAIAFISKFGGAYLAARLSGEDNNTALTIGVCMNTRALMELVALNIGYDLGVLPKQMFTMLVIMAVVSTFIATPLIRLLMKTQIATNTSDAENLEKVSA